jgi:hypothetical protein
MRLGTACAAAAVAVAAGGGGVGTARAAEGQVALSAPGDASTWAAGSTLRFAWTPVVADPVADVLLVASDARFADLVFVRSWSCEPACATGEAVGGLAPGSYYWGVGFKLGSGAAVLSAPWRFTITPPPKARLGAPLRPPTRHRPTRKHRRNP